jgi:hypothetical protein
MSAKNHGRSNDKAECKRTGELEGRKSNAVQGFVRRAKCSYVIRQGSLSEDLSSPIQ